MGRADCDAGMDLRGGWHRLIVGRLCHWAGGIAGILLPAYLPAGCNGGDLMLQLEREAILDGFGAQGGHDGRGAVRRRIDASMTGVGV